MRQANALSAFIVLVRFYEATDQLRARSPWSDAQSIPSTPKEHGTSCLSSQGTNQMIIQATQSSNWRHSEEQGESRFATPRMPPSLRSNYPLRELSTRHADHLIDRPDCSCFVVGETGFEPMASCAQGTRSTRLSYTPMCPFASRRL